MCNGGLKWEVAWFSHKDKRELGSGSLHVLQVLPWFWFVVGKLLAAKIVNYTGIIQGRPQDD